MKTLKQTTKRILSILLVILTLVSTISVVSYSQSTTEKTLQEYIRDSENLYGFYYELGERFNLEMFNEIFSPYDGNYALQEYKRILKQLNLNGLSDRKKVEKIAEWIWSHGQYGTKLILRENIPSTIAYYPRDNQLNYITSPWIMLDQYATGILADGRAVCAGLSDCMFQLTALCGIETMRCNGTSGGKAHAWVVVKLDGEWLSIDLAGAANQTFGIPSGALSRYKCYSATYYNPATNLIKYLDVKEIGDAFPVAGDDLIFEGNPSAPEISVPTITAEPACGASVKVNFSKVDGAICYMVFRNHYIEGKDYNPTGYKYNIIGSSIATISPEKAERNGYVFYDNTYDYDYGEPYQDSPKTPSYTSDRLQENKMYVYTVVAYGAQKSFQIPYCSNSVIVTTNPDKGDLKFNKWDGKLEPHTFGEPVVTVPATCGHTGIKTITCQDCGYTYYADTPRSENGHDYKQTSIVKATCETAGKRTLQCSICEKTKTETIPATGHKFGTPVIKVKSTCEADGYSVATCSVCKQEKKEILPATGHKFGTPVVKVKNTCEADGYSIATCSVCKQEKKEILPAIGHTLKKTQVVSNGKTTLGYTVYTCSSCGYSCKKAYVAPTGSVGKFGAIKKTQAAETLEWAKVSSASGYQLQRSTADGKAWDTGSIVKLEGNSNVKYTYKKLSAMSNYKFRIRFYIRGEDGKLYYGSWSKITAPTLPKVTDFNKVYRSGKKISANIKKANNVTGYQIQYSVNSNFSNSKKVTIYGAKYTSKTFSVPYRSRYYVRVRTFKNIGGTYYFSLWSSTRKTG